MANWKKNVLSKVRRRILVQSVMNAIPIYTMQSVLLPMATCQQLDRIARNFLWTSLEGNPHNHLVNWDTVCLPKNIRSLRLHSTKDCNLSLLAKVGW